MSYKTLDSTEYFHFNSNSWAKVSNLPEPRKEFTASTVGDKIYLGGGIANEHWANIYQYDIF